MSNVSGNVFKFNRVKHTDRRNTRSLCNLQNSNVQFTSHQFENYFCTDLNHAGFHLQVAKCRMSTVLEPWHFLIQSYSKISWAIKERCILRIDLNNCTPLAHPIAVHSIQQISQHYAFSFMYVICTTIQHIFRSEKEKKF